MKATKEANWFVVVGSTMLVYPAAALLAAIPDSCHLVVIDPQEVEFLEECYYGYTYIPEKASDGLFYFMEMLAKYERSKKFLENYLRCGKITPGID